MGLVLGAYTAPQRIVTNVSDFVRGRKRKLGDRDNQEDIDKVIEIAMHTPKRKKLESTAQYIYNTLFREGKNSDVTVEALDTEFRLHKIYLCQSPYFACMFGGSWLETEKNNISIDVVDPLITVDSLRLVFGSLYRDEVTLNPVEVVSVLATATMFQLDGVIDRCTEVMLETINPKTALDYYTSACRYGDTKVRDECVKWFLVNLMGHYRQHHAAQLRTFPASLMSRLVSHPDLCVMKTEITLYVLLTQWMYLQLHPDEEGTAQDVSRFFASRKDDAPFLATEEGRRYATVFRGLRLQHLVSHHMDVELLLRDNVIPRGWIHDVVLKQWRATLKVNQNEEKGPVECGDETFLAASLRCGRTLELPDKHMWRWTGFHYGIDLVMIADERGLSIKRNHRPEFEQLLSLQTVRHISIRVIVYTLDEQRRISFAQSSGVKHLPLAKGEQVTLLTFDRVTYPLVISANVLFVTPGEKDLAPPDVIHTVT